MKIMVIGGSGSLGKLICTELTHAFPKGLHLSLTDYQKERGEKTASSFSATFCQLDVSDKEMINKALHNLDLVIVAVPQTTPLIQEVCITRSIPCVDVTAFGDFADKVQAMGKEAKNQQTCSIVMAGFFPGVSGLMVKKAIEEMENITDVHVGLLQNTNARVGLRGTLDMLRIISTPLAHDGTKENKAPFLTKRHMPFLHYQQTKEVREIDHDEKQILEQAFHLPSLSYWTAWNKASFNRLLSFLIKTGIVKQLLGMKNPSVLAKGLKHNDKKEETAGITVEVKGTFNGTTVKRTLMLSAFSDYHFTAVATVAIASRILKEKPLGVCFPFEITSLDDALHHAMHHDIKTQETTVPIE